jgi:alanyl-tRNA synthetase
MRETGATDAGNNSLKVIADHIRACSFLIVDGVIPGNEGRGYVLRRVIRRAIRHGYKLGCKTPFFHKLVADLAAVMGEAYPELVAARDRVTAVLKQEEERFAETLENGMGVLETAMASEDRMLDGETVFKLYDTFGFPLDLTADIARERGITVDFAGFEAAMEQQRERARAASKFTMGKGLEFSGEKTEFVGYDRLEQEGRIVALYKDGGQVGEIHAGDVAVVVLDRTPFYAESGGQAGDVGEIASGHGSFTVEDTQKIQADVFGHTGKLAAGKLAVGDTVTARVDTEARQRAAYNHSATHLMHAALRGVLGSHVVQKGSLVNAERTRFDFAHPQPVTLEEIKRIEDLVNAEIRRNNRVETRLMKHEDAIKAGAMALFGEKYGDEVRVVGMGEFSTELCGGTHVKRTGDIGLFKVVAEGGVAAGIRRIEAVTGPGAVAAVQEQEGALREVADRLKAQPGEVAARIQQIQEQVRTLEKELARYKSKLAGSQSDDLLAQAIEICGIKVLAATIEGADAKALREMADKLRDKLKSCALVLGSAVDGKVALIAAVTADLTAKVKAGELVNFVAGQVGGKGGGKPDLAQAGGTEPEKLPAALRSVADWVRGKLN